MGFDLGKFLYDFIIPHILILLLFTFFMALNGLGCAEVPLRNCSLTYSLLYDECIVCLLMFSESATGSNGMG